MLSWLAPLDPLWGIFQNFAPAGVEIQLLARMWIVSVLGFVAGRWVFENAPLPLPKYSTWNKSTWTHFVWSQVWVGWLAWTGWQMYHDAHSNSSLFADHWENRVHKAVPGGSEFCHAQLAWLLSGWFILWWFQLETHFGSNDPWRNAIRILLWTGSLHPFMQYWAVRAGGPPHIASWFLLWVQGFNSFSSLKAEWPWLDTLCRLGFSLSFLVVRVGLWSFWTLGLYHDLWNVWRYAGFSWVWGVAWIGWSSLTWKQWNQGVDVWQGMVDYLQGSAAFPRVIQLRAKVD